MQMSSFYILKSLIVIIHVEETEKYFPVVLFIVYRSWALSGGSNVLSLLVMFLSAVIQTKSFRAILSSDAFCYSVQDGSKFLCAGVKFEIVTI